MYKLIMRNLLARTAHIYDKAFTVNSHYILLKHYEACL